LLAKQANREVTGINPIVAMPAAADTIFCSAQPN